MGKIRESLITNILFCFRFLLLCRSYSGTILLYVALKKMPLSFPSRPLHCSILPPTQPPKKGSTLDPAHSPPDLRGEKKVQVGKEKGDLGPPCSLPWRPLAPRKAVREEKGPLRPFQTSHRHRRAIVSPEGKPKRQGGFLTFWKREKNGGKRTRKNRLRRTNWVAWTIGGINGRGERHKQPRALSRYCPVKDSPRKSKEKRLLPKGNCPPNGDSAKRSEGGQMSRAI